MQYKNMGKTGLKISEMSLGSNNFGRQVDEETTIKIVKKALDSGVNSIDTANQYTGGKSEEIIGKAIKGDRNRVVIGTKVGNQMSPAPNEGGLSRKHIMWQISESLRKLQTDYIDIYYMHRFDPVTPFEETLRTFDYLIREGKILYLACSNFTVENIRSMNAVAEKLGLERIVALQPPYNLANRDVEKELLPYCRENQLGVIAYSPLMGGFLTGKYEQGAPPPAGVRYAAGSPMWDRVNRPDNFTFMSQVKAIADGAGVSIPNVALQWLLNNPAVTSIVVGASRPEQVEENVKLIETKVPEQVLASLSALKTPPPPPPMQGGPGGQGRPGMSGAPGGQGMPGAPRMTGAPA